MHAVYGKIQLLVFLLTRPLRGVTAMVSTVMIGVVISTHTPLARRDFVYWKCGANFSISTHTPLARRDF